MAVVAFPMDLAPQGPEPSQAWELRSLTAINRSPLNAVATSLERAGAHFAIRLPYDNLAESRRARLQTFATAHRGSANRFYVPVFGWTRRGSFPATELFSNQYFSSGTTGWTATNCTLTASDGLLRIAVTTPILQPSASQSIALTQYAPYALRSILIDGAQTNGLTVGRFISDGTLSTSDVSTSRGLGTAVLVPASAAQTDQFPAFFSSASGFTSGAYLTVAYTSLARCALVDNGPNFLLRSDEFDNASWTKTAGSVSANAGSPNFAPDGTATADSFAEDGTSAQHMVSQSVTISSSAADYAISVAVKAGSARNVFLEMVEATGGGIVRGIFNPSTGAVVTQTSGSNWANERTFAVSLGSSWWSFTLVARKTNAATTLTVRIGNANGTSVSYLGDGTSNNYLWRATLAQSSVPTRLRQTTSAAASSGTSQTGGAIYLKGLPASSSGLLLQGDPAEIIIGTTSQLVRTRASLDSDAAGLGYWQFEPPLRVSPSDNAAVIIQNPLCKMMMENNVAGWTDRLGGFSDTEFACVEDTFPS